MTVLHPPMVFLKLIFWDCSNGFIETVNSYFGFTDLWWYGMGFSTLKMNFFLLFLGCYNLVSKPQFKGFRLARGALGLTLRDYKTFLQENIFQKGFFLKEKGAMQAINHGSSKCS